ncbi:hypothetical protein CNMCM6106_008982 [Aspergillus hiratsukae]|uniref:Uncharacterized protein n=1 Tax=Aspergillus hiratsukae TaxID=1194566 RepID=A0A8H6PVD8_9EURO|nr:hypothetical protein CNMCM6106_008982 [Aspergillus hiratsukae]
MSAKHEPSLLEYARFHGIARDYTAIHPSEQLDHSLELPPEDPPVPEDKLKSLDKYLLTTRESVEEAIREEKLNVRKEDARLLSAVLRDVRTHEFEFNLEDQLAAFHRHDKLKLEPPIFSLDYETRSALPQCPVLYDTEGLSLAPLEEAPEYHFETLVKNADEINKQIRNEKLNCTKQSFMLIQDAVKLENASSNPLDDILVNTIRPTVSFGSESPALAPLDANDLSFKSPSPEPELQMLPSPASTEVPETSKPQNYPSVDSDASHSPQVFDCVRRTSKGDVDGMLQIDHHLSAAEERQARGNAATVDFDEPCESTTFAGERPRVEGHSQDIQPQADLDIPDLANHDDASEDGEPASRSAQSAEPGVSEEEVGLSVTEAPTEEDTAGLLPSRHPSVSPSAACYFSHTNDAACEASLQCSNNDSKESGAHHSARLFHASSTQRQPNKRSISNITVETSIVSTDTKVPAPPVLDPQLITEQEQSPSRLQQSNRRAFTVDDSGLTAAHQTGLLTNTSPTVTRQPLQQRKRKRQLSNESFAKASQLKEQQEQPAVPSSSTLGSLAAFMETRGRNEKRHTVAQSPYFPVKKSIDVVPKRQSDAVSTEKAPSSLKKSDKSENVLDIMQTATQLPRFQQQTGERPILFLSTALLKSHLRLVRCLEGMAGQPAIVYRDYNHTNPGAEPQGKHTTSHLNSNPTLQIEADIIISPSTGIILTTSQATTQLYLPGHKFTHPEMKIECINSPLRERIFLLAPRYERIYLFICHSAPSPKKLPVKQSGPSADKRVLTSIASLTAFCTSLSTYATISPLLVPSCPETVAGWVLSLANKHIARLPGNLTRNPPSTSFTPINSTRKNRLDPETMMRTTAWELFLRQAGLNPYAAQAILAFLRREDEEEWTHIRYTSRTAAVSSSVNDEGGHGLARFIEMALDRRTEVFGELVGDRMMGRINHILDKDWQCDWALNFDADLQV